MKSQVQIFYDSHNKLSRENNLFMELINNKDNPLTKQDLINLIKRFPQRWKRFEEFIDKLK